MRTWHPDLASTRSASPLPIRTANGEIDCNRTGRQRAGSDGVPHGAVDCTADAPAHARPAMPIKNAVTPALEVPALDQPVETNSAGYNDASPRPTEREAVRPLPRLPT